jgi:hypothetical protein
MKPNESYSPNPVAIAELLFELCEAGMLDADRNGNLYVTPAGKRVWLGLDVARRLECGEELIYR